MEFKKKIYNFNASRWALLLLPVENRQPALMAFANAFAAPLDYLMGLFYSHKKTIEYELTITPQVCFLEKMLNDFYDPTERRIFISEAELQEQPALYVLSEGDDKGLLMYLKSEDISESYFVTKSEHTGDGGFFIVNVPFDLVYNVNTMRGHINKYKLPSTIYNIVTV